MTATPRAIRPARSGPLKTAMMARQTIMKRRPDLGCRAGALEYGFRESIA
jgi:hypothetical protein